MVKEHNGEDFAALLDEFEQTQSQSHAGAGPAVGDKVEGKVVSIGEEVAFVDLGAKAEGMVAVGELKDEANELGVAVGDTIEALVAAVDRDTGCFVLRVRPGRGEALRAELEQAYKHGISVEGLVREVNKGGVDVEVAGLRAFCPISQLERRYVEDSAEYVGRRLNFRITRYEEASRGRPPNLVLSRRALLEDEARARASETRDRLAVDAVVHGTVTSLASYGAFVDLGGLEGLLHVSQISHSRLAHPSEVLSVGQEVEVQILKIEPPKDSKGKERISLSMRSLATDPWQEVVSRYAEGSVKEGRIVRLEAFGAFVELEPGIEGLVHVSALGSEKRVNHPREVVEIGQGVRVKVLNVDAQKRRISLSIAGARSEEEARDYEEYARPQGQGASSGLGSLGDFFKQSRRR